MHSGSRTAAGGLAILASLAMVLTLVGCDAPKSAGTVDVAYFTEPGDEAPFVWGVSVDGASPHDVSSSDSGTFVLAGLSTGDHHLIVSSLPIACTSGTDDRLVSVPNADTVHVQIVVQCTPRAKPIIRVVTATAGTNPDFDGYTVLVNSLPFDASINDTILVAVAPGPTTVTLRNVEPNCSVSNPSQSRTVTSSDSAVFTFSVLCGDYPIGVIGTTFDDPPGDTAANPQNISAAALDIVKLTTRYTSTFITFTLRMSHGFGSDPFLGFIDLDTDENAATGYTPYANVYGGAQLTQGVDAWLQLEGPVPNARLQTSNTDVPLRMLVAADSIIVYVPYEKLADDGNLTISTVIGPAQRATDYAPNTGLIVSHVPPGVTSALRSIVPRSAADQASALLRSRTVAWARATSVKSAPPRR